MRDHTHPRSPVSSPLTRLLCRHTRQQLAPIVPRPELSCLSSIWQTWQAWRQGLPYLAGRWELLQWPGKLLCIIIIIIISRQTYASAAVPFSLSAQCSCQHETRQSSASRAGLLLLRCRLLWCAAQQQVSHPVHMHLSRLTCQQTPALSMLDLLGTAKTSAPGCLSPQPCC